MDAQRDSKTEDLDCVGLKLAYFNVRDLLAFCTILSGFQVCLSLHLKLQREKEREGVQSREESLGFLNNEQTDRALGSLVVKKTQASSKNSSKAILESTTNNFQSPQLNKIKYHNDIYKTELNNYTYNQQSQTPQKHNYRSKRHQPRQS